MLQAHLIVFHWVLKQAGQASCSCRALSLDMTHQSREKMWSQFSMGVMKNRRHLIQYPVAVAGVSAWVVKAKNNLWGMLQRGMLERNLVSFPTPRRETGKGHGRSQPAGTPLVSSAAHELLPVGRS